MSGIIGEQSRKGDLLFGRGEKYEYCLLYPTNVF